MAMHQSTSRARKLRRKIRQAVREADETASRLIKATTRKIRPAQACMLSADLIAYSIEITRHAGALAELVRCSRK